jgi:hypothetical protein
MAFKEALWILETLVELTLGQSALQIWMFGRNDGKEAGLQKINEDWWAAWQVHLSLLVETPSVLSPSKLFQTQWAIFIPAYTPVHSQSYNIYSTVAAAKFRHACRSRCEADCAVNHQFVQCKQIEDERRGQCSD